MNYFEDDRFLIFCHWGKSNEISLISMYLVIMINETSNNLQVQEYIFDIYCIFAYVVLFFCCEMAKFKPALLCYIMYFHLTTSHHHNKLHKTSYMICPDELKCPYWSQHQVIVLEIICKMILRIFHICQYLLLPHIKWSMLLKSQCK